MSQQETTPLQPLRMWWARPRKLLTMERPGGGGRSHRPDRRRREIDWMRGHGVRVAISTMSTRHNLGAYDELGLEWHHVPVADAAAGADALEELLGLLRSELRRSGAAAVHGDSHTDFAAAVGAAHLYETRGVSPVVGLARAQQAGLRVTQAACTLLGVDEEEVLEEAGLEAMPA